ncbi:uncharacterized protein LOC125178370 isoform X2 [Hyalella azteca]|nr:uncharacterized protein LOC125178370 isoform X2 [Hyalella azteca]
MKLMMLMLVLLGAAYTAEATGEVQESRQSTIEEYIKLYINGQLKNPCCNSCKDLKGNVGWCEYVWNGCGQYADAPQKTGCADRYCKCCVFKIPIG